MTSLRFTISLKVTLSTSSLVGNGSAAAGQHLEKHG